MIGNDRGQTREREICGQGNGGKERKRERTGERWRVGMLCLPATVPVMPGRLGAMGRDH